MSNKAITWAYGQANPRLKAGPKFILVALADLADSEHSCYPGVAELARMTATGLSTVKRQLDLLIELGYITSERRHRKDGSRTSNRYYLQLDPKPESDARPHADASRMPATATSSETSTSALQPDSGASKSPEIQGLGSRPSEIHKVSNRDGLSPELEDPRSRIGGGILEPLVNPKTEPTVNALDARVRLDNTEEFFELFWIAYPRHEAKKPALAAFVKAAKKLSPPELVQAAIAYRDDPTRNQDATHLPYAATWLNQERWNDERTAPPASPPRSGDRISAIDHNLALVAQFRNEESHGQATDRPAIDPGLWQ